MLRTVNLLGKMTSCISISVIHVYKGILNFFKIILFPLSFLIEPVAKTVNFFSDMSAFISKPFSLNNTVRIIILLGVPYFWWGVFGISGDQVNSVFFEPDFYLFNIFYYYLLSANIFIFFLKSPFIIWPYVNYVLINMSTSLFYIGSNLCPADLSNYLENYLFLVHSSKISVLVEWFIDFVDYDYTLNRSVFEYSADFIRYLKDINFNYILSYEFWKDIVRITCPTHWHWGWEYFSFYNDIIKCFNAFISWITCDYLLFTFISFFIILPIVNLVSLLTIGLYGTLYFLVSLSFFFLVLVMIKFNFFFLKNGFIKTSIFKWFNFFGYKPVYFELSLDSLGYSYILLTLSIALFVFIYTFSYFRYEPNVERLMLLISSFVASMVVLVAGGNMFVLYLGWELIGITSFFLINFWSTKISTLKAAFKAFAFNKLSDVSLLFAICIIFYFSNNGNIHFITSTILFNNYSLNFFNSFNNINKTLCALILIAAFIKSAQIGFHIWLPDSMEAPVPASALIHSATLVSAGVYLVLRFSNLFDLNNLFYFIFIVGLITAFIGGVTAAYQSDSKKTLAYSTISHCGFLIAGCFFKLIEISIFYLYVHGFFKAIIFMSVGNVIRITINQDTRLMGLLWKYLSFEFYVFVLCLLNLSGFPFSLGFYMKHYYLIMFVENFFIKIFLFIVLILAAFAGLIYCYRLFYSIFFDFKKSDEVIYLAYNKLDNWNSRNTTTPMGAVKAILFLILVGMILNWIVYFMWISNVYVIDIYENSFFLKNQHNDFFLVNFEKNLVISWLNYIILYIISSICFITWRYSNIFKKNFFFFSNLVIPTNLVFIV